MDSSSGDGIGTTASVSDCTRAADPGDKAAGDCLQVDVKEVNGNVIPIGTQVPIAEQSKFKNGFRKMYKWCKKKVEKAERMFQSLRNSKAAKVIYVIGVIIDWLYRIYKVIEFLSLCLNV